MKEIFEKLRKKEPVTVAFLGDSVTQGCFEVYYNISGGLETVCRPQYAYSQKLKEIFAYAYPDSPFNVLNYGKSGDTARSGYERLDEMLSHAPDAAVVCFGLNDSCGGEDGIAEYREYLQKIFERTSTIPTIFMTPNMMANKKSNFLIDKRLNGLAENFVGIQAGGLMEKYMDAAKEVCAKNRTTVCDCYSVWKAMDKNGVNIVDLLANGLNHPTEKMHAVFAYELFKTMLLCGGEQ